MQKFVPDYVLLGLIKANPSHGYELLDRFKSKSDLGRIWTMSTSQVYAVLKRLEKEGLVIGKAVHRREAPSRKEYSITFEGEEKLKTWLYDTNPSPSIHWIRVIFLSKLYIADLLTMPKNEIIEHQRRVCFSQHQDFSKERHQAQTDFEGLVLDYILNQLDAAQNWLEALSQH